MLYRLCTCAGVQAFWLSMDCINRGKTRGFTCSKHYGDDIIRLFQKWHVLVACSKLQIHTAKLNRGKTRGFVCSKHYGDGIIDYCLILKDGIMQQTSNTHCKNHLSSLHGLHSQEWTSRGTNACNYGSKHNLKNYSFIGSHAEKAMGHIRDTLYVNKQ